MAQWFGMAVAAAALCMVVRSQQPELASLCAIAAGTLLLLSALGNLEAAQAAFARLSSLGGLQEGSMEVLAKVIGVSFLAELAAQTCGDMGEGGLALKVGLAGRLCVFALSMPLLIKLLEMILELAP